MSKITYDELKGFLWKAADILRGKIDSSDYKNYIFGLLFLKRLSDVFEEENIMYSNKHGYYLEEVEKDRDQHKFYVPKKARWKHIQNQTENIGETLDKAFERIEDENENIKQGILTSVSFNDKKRLPDTTLRELILHFSKKRLRNEDLEDADLFGRAYEYLIRQFADDAGKKGGEFYTPREVVQVITEILDPKEGMSIYDPCCGSGGMLIYSAHHLQQQGGDPQEDISLYGQERNVNTWSICEMNMILHGLEDAFIEQGDTMRNPKFTNNKSLETFDLVLANPMWNQKKWGKKELDKGDEFNRFKFGLPSANSADWAWIQHMLASLNNTGKMGVVMDNGVLFRSRSEGKIRKKALEEDLVEAVIALPKNLFANTSSPGCILIMNKDKPSQRKDKVLFIYAEEEKTRESNIQMFKELSNQNQLTKEGVQKTVQTYKNYVQEDHHSKVATLQEIKENDYNLNVPRYVDTTKPQKDINVTKKLKELKTLKQERKALEQEFHKNMEELSYK